ncbi:MAG: ATP-binding protein [Promethearchaeota archaeon]
MKISNYTVSIKNGACTSCNAQASLILRKYSGEALCPACFEKSVENNIRHTISKYKMLKPSNKIVVGFSGGKDSIALLYNLFKIQEKSYKAKPIVALTINEGIKDYRDNSINFANKFCEKYEIEHKIVSFEESIGKTLDEINNIKKKISNWRYTCNYCAVIRRRLLNETARDLRADRLAIGHNLTDFAETYLMNIMYNRFHLISNQYLFKGDNSDVNNYFVKKITPLMRIPEEEIFIYSNLKKFNYYSSHCPYREKEPILRKRVLDFIQDCKVHSPEIEFNLFNGFLKLSELLYNYEPTGVKYGSCPECGYPSGNNSLCTYCEYIKKLST